MYRAEMCALEQHRNQARVVAAGIEAMRLVDKRTATPKLASGGGVFSPFAIMAARVL